MYLRDTTLGTREGGKSRDPSRFYRYPAVIPTPTQAPDKHEVSCVVLLHVSIGPGIASTWGWRRFQELAVRGPILRSTHTAFGTQLGEPGQGWNGYQQLNSAAGVVVGRRRARYRKVR